jgi:predicted N-formylglutamate amidohydrolase
MNVHRSVPPLSHPQNMIRAHDGGESFEVIAGAARGGIMIMADHASNAMPVEFAGLGLPPEELQRHIAYDIGVEWLTLAMAEHLEAPAVLSRFSRLLIDPNRGDDDPTLVMRLSDGAVIPGNARIDRQGVEGRMRRFSLPYHHAVSSVIDAMTATGVIPAVVSIHSFTPCMKGRERPWHVGILWDSDPRLPLALLDVLRRDTALIVGDNEPYDGALKGDSMARHCISRGIAHILIEVRQDLIADKGNAMAWGRRLADDLMPLLQTQDMHQIRHFGTRAG